MVASLLELFVILAAVLAVGTLAAPGIFGSLLIGYGLVLVYAAWTLVLFARGTTPGKQLLGLRVITEDGITAKFSTMLLREWPGKAICGLPFFLGFLWILFDRNNQGWHDKLMSTYVVE